MLPGGGVGRKVKNMDRPGEVIPSYLLVYQFIEKSNLRVLANPNLKLWFLVLLFSVRQCD